MPKKSNKSDLSTNEMQLAAPDMGKIIDFNKEIKQLENDSTLILENGTYLIDKTIKLNKSIRLVGKGSENTIIAGKDLNCLLKAEGNHHIELEGISFICLGEKATTLIHVEDITLVIKECAFTGAAIDQNGKLGMGIYAEGKTGLEITNCQFEDNQNDGILIGSNATAKIVENKFFHNEVGIAGVGNATINAVRNHFTKNHVSLALDIS